MTTQTTPQTAATTTPAAQKNRRRRVVAVALVGLGVAGLATASASMLSVSAEDRVASGSAPVVSEVFENATATLATTRTPGGVPQDGAVPVDLAVTVSGATGAWAGTVYLGDDVLGTFTDADATATFTGAGLDSHTELDTVTVVLEQR
ncbi:hypothetical protein [Cellulomonas biazotea]|jgi:hypothetical protein|uniref:Uncharacterized protein n=1 Tax=Cellulomonas biazotea TaxID=1709 RepID=A0A402DV31_9CELL|nr:hypothetical protein [Cellulomonas biazotea]GCE77952.1 hypothetical protein CBZ_30080 [Cellulomonas biazotea]